MATPEINKQKELNFDLNSIDDTLHFLIKQKNVKGRTNMVRKKIKFSLEKAIKTGYLVYVSRPRKIISHNTGISKVMANSKP